MTILIDERKEVLRQAFPKLDDEALSALATAAREEIYPVGSNLCRQGEKGETLYVIVSGQADVFVQADKHSQVRVNSVGPHTYLGEMALLVEDTVRSATIQAQRECHVLAIDRDPFLQIADQNPILLRRLASQLTDHLRNNDRAVISELRQKNQALEEAYADLAAQERMRREFVTTMSHELRTPLTSIQGYLQLMNKGMIKGESLPVALDSVTRNVEKLIAMTNNLLVLYEMQLTTPEFTDLNLIDLLVEAVRKIHDAPEFAEARISVEMSPQIPTLQGDRNGLILALHAIIENAVKFSPEHAPVQVNAYLSDSQMICIDVIDEGLGIPTEEQEAVFKPFYRLEHLHGGANLFEGIGIGLSIARFIVERHNGRISITSAPNKGSTFAICLPPR